MNSYISFIEIKNVIKTYLGEMAKIDKIQEALLPDFIFCTLVFTVFKFLYISMLN